MAEPLVVGSAGRPRVAILCATLWGIRNVVHAGMIADLVERGLEPWVLLPPELQVSLAELCTEYCGYADLLAPPEGPARALPAQRLLLQASFARRHRLQSFPIFSRWKARNESAWLSARRRLLTTLAFIGAHEPIYGWQIRSMNARRRGLTERAAVRAQLRSIAPALVVSTNCQFIAEEPYLLAARELGIPTLGCIQSFDNLTSRGILPTFEAYAVWSNRMRDDLHRLYPSARTVPVHVTGSPQFDFHVRLAGASSRGDTLAELGLGPDDRYILFAGNAAEFTPTEPSLLAALTAAIARCPELSGHRIVLRPHPMDDIARWRTALDTERRVLLCRPWADGKLPHRADQQRLVGLLRHADVCVNMASTMTLDSAVVDTPVVCTAFALAHGSPEDEFCREVYATDHYAPVVASGAARVVRSLDELMAEVRTYATDRSRDAGGRAALVRDQCGPADGCAAERIAQLIDSLVRREAHAWAREAG
jgi:hypothetical protein